MRITTSQLRRIIMEEVSAANRKKRLQETKQRRLHASRVKYNRRRISEAYANATLKPKETLYAAGIILAILGIAGQLNRAFDIDGSQERAAAEKACQLAPRCGSPEDVLKAAKEMYDVCAPAESISSAGEDVPYEDDYDSGEVMSYPSSYFRQ